MAEKYIRIRGRILGPFSEEKLRHLARRGQFGRMHEISNDGESWQRAANFPDLFVFNDHAASGMSQASAAAANDDEYQLERDKPPKAEWFYAKGDEQFGPVSFDELTRLANSGHLRPHDRVWREGMASWAPAETVTGLFAGAPTSGTALSMKSSANSGHDATVFDDVRRSIRGSRPWILFVSICAFVLAAIQGLGGPFMIAAGIKQSSAGDIAGGLFAVLWAILTIVGAVILTLFHRRAGIFVIGRDPEDLVRSLDILRVFWAYVGIVMIVLLTVVGIMLIFAYATGLAL